MKLIIGLGNIGAHFDGTRHNTGFMVLDSLVPEWQDKPKFKARITQQGQVLFAKPTTYYNLSGESVRVLKDFYKVDNAAILVVHDELALPFGTIRTRAGGSDAGNNGIKSVIAHIGTNFARIRVGIANPHSATQDMADFVLGHFTAQEREQLPAVLSAAGRAVHSFIDNTFHETTLK